MRKSTQPKLSSQLCCDQFPLHATKNLEFPKLAKGVSLPRSPETTFLGKAIRDTPESLLTKIEWWTAP
jgi:hypothetical protein